MIEHIKLMNDLDAVFNRLELDPIERRTSLEQIVLQHGMQKAFDALVLCHAISVARLRSAAGVSQ